MITITTGQNAITNGGERGIVTTGSRKTPYVLYAAGNLSICKHINPILSKQANMIYVNTGKAAIAVAETMQFNLFIIGSKIPYPDGYFKLASDLTDKYPGIHLISVSRTPTSDLEIKAGSAFNLFSAYVQIPQSASELQREMQAVVAQFIKRDLSA